MKTMRQVQDSNHAYETAADTAQTNLKSKAKKKKDPQSGSADQLDDYDYMGNHDDYDYMGYKDD